MKRFFMAKLAALALLLLAGPTALASHVAPGDLSWNYNFAASPVAIVADDGASTVSLTNEPSGLAVGTSDVVATNLKVQSSATVGSPATLTSTGAYTLTLALSAVDEGTTFSETITFSGKLGGSFHASGANVT